MAVLAALLFGPSAGAGTPASVQFCGANQVCVQASSLKLSESFDDAWSGRGVDVKVQLTLATPIPQYQLRQADVFASHLATVHLGNWSQVVPQPLRFDDTQGSSCTDSPCTLLTDEAQYALHFTLNLPKNFPLGFHQLWLTLPGENRQTLSSPHYGYATPVPQPTSTYHLAGDVLTIKINSVAFGLATPAQPIFAWVSGQVPGTGAMRGRIAAATASASVILRHPAKSVTLTVRLHPAGHWYVQWSTHPADPRDLRFGQFDGKLRQYQIHG